MPLTTATSNTEVSRITPVYRKSQIRIDCLKCPTSPAQLASNIAERIALSAATPDGEDSAGRQRMRLASPEEIAARSCDIASALWEQWASRGWLLDLAPLDAELAAQEEK